MSRPRFLADNDLKQSIVWGVLRRDSAIEFFRCRDFGLAASSDAEVLEFAAANGFVVVSHDVSTMPAEAISRVRANLRMSGLLLARQTDPIGPIIDSLVLIWAATEADEWLDTVDYLPI